VNKLYLIFYRKVPYNEFINLFSGTLFVAGQTVDNVVLDFIDKIELDKIDKIVILTPLSNIENFDLLLFMPPPVTFNPFFQF